MAMYPTRGFPGSWARQIGIRTLVVGFTAVVVVSHPAAAAPLKNFVTDLFGGQGITILDPGEGLEVLSINGATLQSFNSINSSVATNLGGSTLTSSVAATQFDISQGLPISTTASLGPIIGERAETLGRGKFDFGISFSRVEFTHLNNLQLNNLTAVAQTPGCTFGAVNCDDKVTINMNIQIERDVASISGAYGITPNWDVGIVVPLVRVVARASATATLLDSLSDGDSFANGSTAPQQSSSGGEATGIGDVVLRTKYNLLRSATEKPFPDLAVYGEVKAPTGDSSNLLGSGNTDVLGELIVSKQLGAIAPHLNFGYQIAAGRGSDIGNFRYDVGVDAQISSDVTVGADVVGRRDDHALNLTDLAIGGKWRVFERNILSVSFLVPVNRDQGLRPDYAWSARWELLF